MSGLGRTYCKNCEKEVDIDLVAMISCPECGCSWEETYCKNCGKNVNGRSIAFCPKCGFSFEKEREKEKKTYCGYCGTKIDEGSAFCPECGFALGNKKVKKKRKVSVDIKKMGKTIVLGGVLGIVIIVAVVGIKVYSYLKSIPSEEQLLSAVNNYQNGGIVTADDTWLYYNNNGLCKVRLEDGSKQTVVSSDIIPEKMFSAGDSIYYYCFPSTYKTNGSSSEWVGDVFTEDCFQMDGKYYYISDGGVYAVEAGNEDEQKKISDIRPTKLLMYKDYIYIFSEYNLVDNQPNENYGTWRIDKDGKNEISLMDFCPNYMVFSDDVIYYTNREGTICSMELDGSQQITYDGTHVDGGLNISDEYVFYLTNNSESKNTTIHRMDKDGSNDIELTQDDCSSINIVGDFIFYINESYGNGIYKMSFDGELNEPIY